MWQQWVQVLLGLWVLAVPFINMSSTAYMWSLVISGVIIAALGLWGALEASSERESGKMQAQH